jgi:hypothetical protein
MSSSSTSQSLLNLINAEVGYNEATLLILSENITNLQKVAQALNLDYRDPVVLDYLNNWAAALNKQVKPVVLSLTSQLGLTPDRPDHGVSVSDDLTDEVEVDHGK